MILNHIYFVQIDAIYLSFVQKAMCEFMPYHQWFDGSLQNGTIMIFKYLCRPNKYDFNAGELKLTSNKKSKIYEQN